MTVVRSLGLLQGGERQPACLSLQGRPGKVKSAIALSMRSDSSGSPDVGYLSIYQRDKLCLKYCVIPSTLNY